MGGSSAVRDGMVWGMRWCGDEVEWGVRWGGRGGGAGVESEIPYI